MCTSITMENPLNVQYVKFGVTTEGNLTRRFPSNEGEGDNLIERVEIVV